MFHFMYFSLISVWIVNAPLYLQNNLLNKLDLGWYKPMQNEQCLRKGATDF